MRRCLLFAFVVCTFLSACSTRMIAPLRPIKVTDEERLQRWTSKREPGFESSLNGKFSKPIHTEAEFVKAVQQTARKNLRERIEHFSAADVQRFNGHFFVLTTNGLMECHFTARIGGSFVDYYPLGTVLIPRRIRWWWD